MWSRLQKLLDRIESRIALWQIASGSGILSFGGLSAWIASTTEWLNAYGPIAWWFAGLLGTLLALLVVLAAAWLRNGWIRGTAIRKWSERVDGINPLDSDFQRQRIKLLDLGHPVKKNIYGKRFVDCQLIGPANIVFFKDNKITMPSFGNCDLVVVNPRSSARGNNLIWIENCQLIGCELLNCTIFLPPEEVLSFDLAGAKFISLTGYPEIDNPKQPSTEEGKKP